MKKLLFYIFSLLMTNQLFAAGAALVLRQRESSGYTGGHIDPEYSLSMFIFTFVIVFILFGLIGYLFYRDDKKEKGIFMKNKEKNKKKDKVFIIIFGMILSLLALSIGMQINKKL